jgi:hypothetical protein
MSILCLICMFNVLLYVVNLHVISKYEIKNKYPFLQKIVNRYEQVSHITIIIEGVIGMSILLFIAILNTSIHVLEKSFCLVII